MKTIQDLKDIFKEHTISQEEIICGFDGYTLKDFNLIKTAVDQLGYKYNNKYELNGPEKREEIILEMFKAVFDMYGDDYKWYFTYLKELSVLCYSLDSRGISFMSKPTGSSSSVFAFLLSIFQAFNIKTEDVKFFNHLIHSKGVFRIKFDFVKTTGLLGGGNKKFYKLLKESTNPEEANEKIDEAIDNLQIELDRKECQITSVTKEFLDIQGNLIKRF